MLYLVSRLLQTLRPYGAASDMMTRFGSLRLRSATERPRTRSLSGAEGNCRWVALLALLLWVAMPAYAQQPQFTGCEKLLLAGQQALNAKQYPQALNKFLALRDCDESQRKTADLWLQKTFDAIEGERRQAEINAKRAKESETAAKKAATDARLAEKNALAEKQRATTALDNLQASNRALLTTLTGILHKANTQLEFDNAADFCAGIANLADLARTDTSALRAVGTAAFAAAYIADSVVKKNANLLRKPLFALQSLYPQYTAALQAAQAPADLRRLLPQVLPAATYQHLLRRYLADMLPVAGGEGIFGEPSNESPAYRIRVSDFEMGRTEVTVHQYNFYCRATGKSVPTNPFPDKQDGTHPIVNVNWYSAVAYCNWLSEVTGKQPAYTETEDETRCNLKANGYRLPTEAEWEYAAYGGQKGKGWMKQTQYAGSDSIDEVAWYDDGKTTSTQPVARKKPNALGIYDLNGNVWEWCWDWHTTNPPYQALCIAPLPADIAGPESGSGRVLRGFSWNYYVANVRVAYRDGSTPYYKSIDVGFRLTRTP